MNTSEYELIINVTNAWYTKQKTDEKLLFREVKNMEIRLPGHFWVLQTFFWMFDPWHCGTPSTKLVQTLVFFCSPPPQVLLHEVQCDHFVQPRLISKKSIQA